MRYGGRRLHKGRKKDFFHFVWRGGGDLEERKGSQTKKEEGKFSLPPQIERKGWKGEREVSPFIFFAHTGRKKRRRKLIS